MYRTKICNFIDIDKYKETFETNLNKGEVESASKLFQKNRRKLELSF